jgi:uncharacterized protein YndB with AHSA1/START domain
MDHRSIDREIHIDASPEVVFDVVSNPAHVRQWWPDEANYEPTPGNRGTVVFNNKGGERFETAFEVVDAIPGRLFSFRWTQPLGEPGSAQNSLLVTFEMVPEGDGTLLRMSETGYSERDWESTVMEETYRNHTSGWDYFLPRLASYAAQQLGVER